MVGLLCLAYFSEVENEALHQLKTKIIPVARHPDDNIIDSSICLGDHGNPNTGNLRGEMVSNNKERRVVGDTMLDGNPLLAMVRKFSLLSLF